MTRWLRFAEKGAAGFGALEADDVIHVHRGDMFEAPTPTERRVQLGDVICCGTSLGVLPMREGTTVEIVIEGIGTLKNVFA